MKRFFAYTGFLLFLGTLFCFTYYQSYKRALKKLNQQNQNLKQVEERPFSLLTDENEELLKRLQEKDLTLNKENQNESEEMDSPLNELQEAGKLQGNTVLPSVTYIEEVYQMADGSLTSSAKTAPGVFIGMNKEELTDYTKEYMQKLPISEYEAGLLAYELVSFSENRVILRKTYNRDEIPFKYYVNITRGMVTVYYSDKETVYEYTHIPAVDLPAVLLAEMTKGIYVKDKDALYALLEGCSS